MNVFHINEYGYAILETKELNVHCALNKAVVSCNSNKREYATLTLREIVFKRLEIHCHVAKSVKSLIDLNQLHLLTMCATHIEWSNGSENERRLKVANRERDD